MGFSRQDYWSGLHKALLLLVNHPVPHLFIQPMFTAASSEIEYSFSIYKNYSEEDRQDLLLFHLRFPQREEENKYIHVKAEPLR